MQPPGDGYRHVVTPAQVRARLAQVPAVFLEQLEVVQFSGMTRKKQSFPCYGMQWGNTLYLYPLEESLVESVRLPAAAEPVQRNPHVRRPLGRALARHLDAYLVRRSRPGFLP